jgi:hypothetical protein
MTLEELMNQLSLIAEVHGNAEIQVVTQPNWPLHHRVSGVCLHSEQAAEIKELREFIAEEVINDPKDIEDAQAQIAKLEESQVFSIIFVEGSYIGYGSRDCWNEDNQLHRLGDNY